MEKFVCLHRTTSGLFVGALAGPQRYRFVAKDHSSRSTPDGPGRFEGLSDALFEADCLQRMQIWAQQYGHLHAQVHRMRAHLSEAFWFSIAIGLLNSGQRKFETRWSIYLTRILHELS